MALQLTGTKGIEPRALTSWMARATSERTCCIAIELPAMRLRAALVGAGAGTTTLAGGRGGAPPLRCSDGRLDGSTVGPPPPRPSADATTPRNCLRSTGLVR